MAKIKRLKAMLRKGYRFFCIDKIYLLSHGKATNIYDSYYPNQTNGS